jgi:hypothetical protein
MKLVVNQAYDNMGLASQTLGPIMDGLMRNTPDAHRFIPIAVVLAIAAGQPARARSCTSSRSWTGRSR